MSILKLTVQNFETETKNAGEPILVDFYADWCGPCRMLAPTIHEIAEEASGFRVAQVNVDSDPALAEAFEVMSIPTLLVLKDGKVKSRAVGMQTKEAVLALLR